VGVSGLSIYAQGDLFAEGLADDDAEPQTLSAVDPPQPAAELAAVVLPSEAVVPPLDAKARWWPGQDIRHDELGSGWVWGRGLGRVTVRFEGPLTAPGPVRTLAADDPALHAADPPDWRTPAERTGPGQVSVT
jgi:DNA polymerase-4